jgi:hypothetical protein
MTSREEIEGNFEEVFSQEANHKKINYLIRYFGEDKLNEALEYCFIFPPRFDKAKRSNPYGLLYIMCKGWDLKLDCIKKDNIEE